MAEHTTQAQRQALIDALNQHRLNTIADLRRVERIFASLNSPELSQPMTAAWVYYVNSNALLNDLRNLTTNYPFSPEIIQAAKTLVHADPASNRSWNYCWLVLHKILQQNLIPAYARLQACRPEMWGNRIPLGEGVERLTQAFGEEWEVAVVGLLRWWEVEPTRR